MLTIQPVRTRRDRRTFVDLARSINPSDSPWIRPLNATILDYLNLRRNPFYQDGRGQAFLVHRDGQPVGRILAHVWHRHHRLHNERVGYFGFFECRDDIEATTLLLNTAADFAREHDCTILRGPFNMTAAQEMGVVTSGFDRPPAVDMVYTPEWYPALLENAGLTQCLRMTTWLNNDIKSLDADSLLTSRHRELQRSIGLTVRPLHHRGRWADLENVRELTNAGFLGNWSFVPITPEEWALQAGPVAPILDPAILLLAEVQGVPVGVTFCVPDFNCVLRRMNGSLMHPAALRLLRRPPTDAALVILFAVRKQYQGLGVNRILNAELVRALQKRGYRSLAITWISESNAASRAQTTALKMKPLHELVMYERRLDA